VSLSSQWHIEFHDSTIVAIVQEGASLNLSVDAYLHHWELVAGMWKGTGWAQPVKISMGGATCAQRPALPADLDGGEIRAKQVTYDNMVPLPLALSGPVTLRLELKTGEMLEVIGHAIAIESTGSGRYVETLPDDFKPA
jgi:hypothetical protein